MYGCAADADKRFIVKKKKTSKLLMPIIMLVLTAALLIAYLALGKSDPAGDETDTGDTNSEVTIILRVVGIPSPMISLEIGVFVILTNCFFSLSAIPASEASVLRFSLVYSFIPIIIPLYFTFCNHPITLTENL